MVITQITCNYRNYTNYMEYMELQELHGITGIIEYNIFYCLFLFPKCGLRETVAKPVARFTSQHLLRMGRMGRLASALLVESRVCLAFASHLRAWGPTGARVGAERGAREVAIAERVAVRNAACVHRTPYPGARSHFSDSHAANTTTS